MRIQALGLTRWSYPFQSKHFRRAETDLKALRAQLYAPARLDHRLFLLEHVLLPGLRIQHDQNFTHVFLIDEQLPQPWRDRLLALLETVPQIVPVFHAEGGLEKDVCRQVMAAHVDPDCDVTAQYRLDDDDGVARDFIARTRETFSTIAPIFAEEGRMGLDFNRGFILQSSDQDITMRPVSMRFWAPGMVVFLRPDSNRMLMDFHHLKLWHYMPTLTWGQRPMFIRGAHHDNDSDLASFGRRARGFNFNPGKPERFYRNHFGVDLPEMQRIWQAEKDYFLNSQGDQVFRRAA